MKIIGVFNNKGGVGKTTLTFHLAHALSEMGKKVLLVDLDPQCNLTIYGIDEESLHKIWEDEDPFIDDFEETVKKITPTSFKNLNKKTHTIHYLLKPTEEGTGELDSICPPFKINNALDLIPGRLSMHMFENKLAERWSSAYQGDPLAIRTITKIRSLAEEYSAQYKYDFVLIDTSPSLGILNKVIISTADGFLIPCGPDMFSQYGIRNIGKSLSIWKKQFDTLFELISEDKRRRFPKNFVRFLGFNIYNAKKYTGKTDWDLAKAHYNYAVKIPDTIREFIKPEIRKHLTEKMINNPIGHKAVMHTHNTLPGMAQKYRCPIWKIPKLKLEPSDATTIVPNASHYYATKASYTEFAEDLLKRVGTLDG